MIMKYFKLPISLLLSLIYILSFSTPEKISLANQIDHSGNLDSNGMTISNEIDYSKEQIDKEQLVVVIKDETRFEEIKAILPDESIISSFENNQSVGIKMNSVEELEAVIKGQGISKKELDVSEDHLAYMHKIPSDPLYTSHQWNLRKINMEKVWDYNTSHRDIIVAVVDSGVTPHFDMKNVINGADLSSGRIKEDRYPGEYSYDGGYHGTAVAAGIASQHNSYGIAGLNPNIKIMGVKVFADGADITPSSTIAAGITWAVDNGADLVNLSVGTEFGSTALRLAVDYAKSKGVLLVASSGNEGLLNKISFPAAYDEVLAVGSTNSYNDQVSRFSNQGNQMDLVAPGESIILPNIIRGEGNYALLNGTSFSAPMVSGAASILFGTYPDLTPDEVKIILKESARDLYQTGWDKTSGYGLLDVHNALLMGSDKTRNKDIIPWDLAKKLYPNQTYKGSFTVINEENLYKFHLFEPYAIEIQALASSQSDLMLKVLDNDGKMFVKENLSNKGKQLSLKTQLETGTYYIHVDSGFIATNHLTYEMTLKLEDKTKPNILIVDSNETKIEDQGLSKTATRIQVTDTSKVKFDIFKNNQALNKFNEVTEEGNYEVIAYDQNGNQASKSFVLDRDGQLSVHFVAGIGKESIDTLVPHNSQVKFPEVAKEHYRLEGWYKDEEKSQLWSEKTLVKRNMILYANWIEDRSNFSILAGADRFATANAISAKTYENSDTAILVQSENFPDALSAGPIAYALDAPILLTPKNRLHETTKAELERLGVKKVIIMGGENAISTSVEDILEKTMAYDVRRIAGIDRYETATLAADYLGKLNGGSDTVILTSGINFADALSVGSYAAKEGIPIVLTNGSMLTNSTRSYLKKTKIKNVIIVGGTSVVDDALEKSLRASSIRIKRIGGLDRGETSVKIGGALFADSTWALIANGYHFADALAAVPYAAKMEGPIIVVAQDKMSLSVENYLKTSPLNAFVVVGGDHAVGKPVKDKLLKIAEH